VIIGQVREAVAADAEACAAIYAPYVTGTVISFEVSPPSAEEMVARITAAQRRHAWVVLEDGGRVVGYAYGGPFKDRDAYRWSCEVSVYVAPGGGRRGHGRALYEGLFERLAARGHRMAFAGMTQPNNASGALHRALGFEPVGTYRRVGWKHGAWHDVTWVQRALTTDDGPPPEPR